jgi:thiamine biosynthesis lipoprotein
MGTILEVMVAAAPSEDARLLAREAIAIAQHWDEVLSPFLAHSELSRLQARKGVPIFASEDLRAALMWAGKLNLETGGAFDPAFPSAPWLRANGPGSLPIFWKSVEFRGAALRIHSAARLDPGAFGKGLALDAILAWMRYRGATEVFLNFGGSSFAREARGRAARVARRVLLPGVDGGPLGIVELRSGSLSVSVSGAREGATSIVDPRSGQPVSGGRIAAAWAKEATVADAWSTALIVDGAPGLQLAEQHGVEGLVVENGSVQTTRSFPLTDCGAFCWQPHKSLSQEHQS